MIHCERKSLNFPAIYRLEYKPAKLSYIGQSICFGRRLNEHRRTIDSPDSDCLWVRILRSRYGQLSFSDDFDVYILDYLDDCDEHNLRDELNRLETLRIKEYDTWDPTFNKGLNYMPGGSGDKRSTKNVLFRTWKNPNVVRNGCIVYNPYNGLTTAHLSLSSAAKSYKLSPGNVKAAYYNFRACNEYYVVPIMPEDRRVKYMNYYYSAKDSISDALSKGDSKRCRSAVASIAKIAYNKMNKCIAIENAIDRSFADEDLLQPDMDEVILTLKEFATEFHKIYNTRCSGFLEDEVDDELNMVVIINDKTETITIHQSIKSASRSIGLSRKHISERVHTDSPACGMYYIYYLDKDLRKIIYEEIMKKKTVSDSDKKHRFYYAKYYHMINKLTGTDTITGGNRFRH